MNAIAFQSTRPTFSAPGGLNLFETFLGIMLVCLLSAGAWSLFSSMPAYGGQPTPPPVTQTKVAVPPPLCFNHTREDVINRDVLTMTDIAAGCPSDPTFYRPATIRQVQS